MGTLLREREETRADFSRKCFLIMGTTVQQPPIVIYIRYIFKMFQDFLPPTPVSYLGLVSAPCNSAAKYLSMFRNTAVFLFCSHLDLDCIAVSDRISVVPTELGLPGGGDPPCPPGRQVGLDALASSSSSSRKNCQFPFHLLAAHVLDERALM